MPPAIDRLADILARGEEYHAVTAMLADRDHVLAEHATLFAEDRLATLTEQEVTTFLAAHPRWWGTARQRSGLVADMPALRQALTRVLDESTAIETRLEWLWPAARRPVAGLAPATATPLLMVAQPTQYGVWNPVSEAAMRQLGLWPEFPRGWSPARQYLLANRVMTTAAAHLGIDLYTLDALLWSVARPAAGRSAPVQRSAAASAGSRTAGSAARGVTVRSTGTAAPKPSRAAATVKEAASFICSSCFLVKPMAQLAADSTCRDCRDG